VAENDGRVRLSNRQRDKRWRDENSPDLQSCDFACARCLGLRRACPPKDEPLNQFVPLVEFRFDSPRGQSTAATVNPGLAYVAVTWQIAAEVIVPLNRAGGNGTGFRGQLLFFLDDLMPTVFGQPLLSNRPARSQIAW
jgi:hypothetical protein